MARRKPTNIEGQGDLFEFLTPESEETRDERLRSYREDQLDEVGPEPVRSTGQPGSVLSEPGEPGRGPDRPASTEPGRAGQSEGGLPGQVGETERGEAAGRGDRNLRGADPAEGSVGDRPTGRVGETGPDVESDQPADRAAGPGSGVDESAFIPASPDDLAPSGTQARFQANIAAIQTLRRIEAENREATAEERQELARWGSWGATGLSEVFNPARAEFEAEREELRQELSEDEYRAAERTVLNAHYTDPRIARTMWQAVQDLGFESGRVLEPGSGSGTFIGTAPEGAEMTGVELDPITAAISQAVYPNANIRTESFADTAVPDDYFDVVIGNVPFGQNVLHDPRHNADRHSMHNHFILKSLDLVKPGGIVGVISSTYTLDAQNTSARQAMHEKADLLTAVRLPNRTFQRSAGTDVATDVLFFRKRHEHETPGNDGWVHTREQRISFGDQEATVTFNEAFFNDDLEGAFINYPQPSTDRFGNPAAIYPTVDTDVTIDVLASRLRGVVTRRSNQGLTYDPTPASENQAMPLIVPDEQNLLDGHITDQGEGVFTIYRQGVQHPLEVPATQRAELSALLGLRDQARRLISAEAQTTTDTEDIAATRRALSDAYAAYVDSYGPINRIKESTTAKGAITRRSAPVMAKLNKDPYGPLVRSLEVYDNATGTAVPASLLSERVLEQRTTITRAESPADALAISLDQTGGVDLDYIADLLETDPQTARDRLGETVFDVPGEDRLETREAYLSGDVRAKLEAAEAAAVENPALTANVEALREVVPTDLQPSEIEARVGASWIPDTVHTEFLREVTGDTTATMRRVSGASWDYSGSRMNRGGWGTEKFPAYRLLGLMAEQKAIIAYHPADADGHRAVDTQETAMANERAENLAERFSEWVWEDPQRASTLAAEYNRNFNNLVLRNYEKAGQALTLPGLVKNFVPREHQRTAVARMLNEPSVGLFHQVGAGKTAEMVMGTMELKRLGMVNKPAVVVPNHMLEQFSREWLGMYPQAKLLTASSEDLRGDDRRAFVARTATGDWDAIILTHSAFSRIPMAPENQSAYLDREVAIQRENLEKSVARAEENGESTGRSTKQLQRRIQAIEERTKALQDTDHDDGLTFEETGIDYLCVDELHEFKNLETVSQIQDASIAGSQKATDLHMKIDYLRAQHGDRVITGATGTPIANSMSEMHVMTRFLRPDLLEAAGLHDFDSWAATFGSVVREMEMTVAGGDSFHMKERFAKFQNVPELLRMFHTFGDVKLQEDLNLPVPQIAARASDGQRTPETLVVQPSEAQKQYVQDMADRYELVTKGSVDPRIDNALKITSDGRKAAADLRLLGDEAPLDDGSSQTKAEATADLLAQVYNETKDNQYLIAGTDQVHPTPGALQVVFCDLGTPKADEAQFSLYDELKTQCAARGIPEEKIRFVHEATNDAKKARLFEQCRSGDVAVLIGSTQKMGVGTNIQARLAHLVHMDCPWRPADVEQRNGRILRQGNQNDEVKLTQVVTKGSVEPFMWQTVERKSAFTNQAMRGRLDVREIEDIGDSTMSFAEVKALATGNPLLIEKSNADQQLSKLERLERGHRQDQSALQFSKAGWVSESTRLQEEIPQLREAAQRTTETAGEKFRMTVPGHGEALTDRTKAAEALAGWAQTNGSHRPPMRGEADLGTCATLGGHDLRMVQGPGVMGDLDSSPVRIDIADAPGVSVETSRKETLTPHRGLITRIENQIAGLDEKADQRAARVEKLEASIADADQRLGKPFEKAADLEVARQNVAELDKKLRAFQAGNPASGGVEQTGAQTALGASTDGPDGPGQTAVMDPPEPESGMSQDDIDQMRTLLGRDFPQNPGTTGPTEQGNPYDPGHGPENEHDRDNGID
jgi:N12 class adenine-specific DNA methylase